MNKYQKLYAKMILVDCMKLSKGQSLVIHGDLENYEFIRLLVREALKIGVLDICLSLSDEYIKKELYNKLKYKELIKHEYFNRSNFDVYAKKGAGFLLLNSEYPGLMSDVDTKLMNKIRKHLSDTNKYFNKCRDKGELTWCIACVPNIYWAKKVYPDSLKPLEKLWDSILKMGEVYKSEELVKTIKDKEGICDILNKLNIKKLVFKNNIGTNLEMELLPDSIWRSGISKLNNKKNILVNYPSEEVFTSPNKYSVNGIVYSSKPLVSSGVVIEDIVMEFKEGKIVKVKSKTHEDILKKMIYEHEGANYLGEVALVEDDSPINKMNTLFYTTLLDENASCHLAFGSSFTECYKNGEKLSNKKREKIGLNTSNIHVDFMFGTKDMDITGVTFDNKEVIIFKDGNFTEEIKSGSSKNRVL